MVFCRVSRVLKMTNSIPFFSEHDYKYVPENAANRVADEVYDDLPVEECSKKFF